ncbi:hypothetical protein LJR153_007289 [Paenibacillus sp. LjRoot153]|uniref:hypothetical protein n=1 Tax=Paenibacillus sp. LjRoot153 TaxID=3342270 RepID=UPI003ECFD416
MRDEIFEIKISLHYKDLDWIAKPFKRYFDPLNAYSVTITLEQFPVTGDQRLKINMIDKTMRGKEVYKWLSDTKKRLMQTDVEGVINIHFRAVFVNGPIY